MLGHVASANQEFQFKLGDSVNVYSDKGFRKTKENVFEAIGNVVITHFSETLYGEKASMYLNSGETRVEGNVRYVGPEFTLYGGRIDYNFLTQDLQVTNARVVADNYVVLGSKINRVSKDVFIAEEAEYSTCRDCPESWSVYGKKVHITAGQYVRITHAFVKIKGVVALYLPYMVFPIKKKRETGLLFPRFGINPRLGTRFQLPFFWAINDQQDMTLTPSLWGKRGFGSQFEYRQMFGEKKWFEINSLNGLDRVYSDDRPYNMVGPNDHNVHFRHLSEYEHVFMSSNNTNHYLYYSDVRDMDFVRDYEQFINNRISGAELGGETFVEKRNNSSIISAEGYFKKTMLVDDPQKFDHGTVQIMPELKLSLVPRQLFNSDRVVLPLVNVGIDADFNYFKQNHITEGSFIRNAYRVNSAPYVETTLARVGPVAVRNKTSFDYQQYYFPFESEQKTFGKNGVLYETEARFELHKMFGVAYETQVSPDRILLDGENSKDDKKNVVNIGPEMLTEVRPFKKELAKDTVGVGYNAFRHTQEFKLKHYYISNQRFWGKEQFYQQIRNPNGGTNQAGIFDQLDAVRGRENELNFRESRTSLPTSNTVELQWNNTLVRKSPKNYSPLQDDRYLINNFDYSQVAYFRLGQGLDFNAATTEFNQRLTRLAMNTGISGQFFSLSLDEYFYHSTNQHLTNLRITRNFKLATVGAGLTYDSFTTPINKVLSLNAVGKPSDLFNLGFGYDYDIELKDQLREIYTVGYTPLNNCWKMDVSYEINQIQKRYSVNFYVNFNENNFTGLGAGR